MIKAVFKHYHIRETEIVLIADDWQGAPNHSSSRLTMRVRSITMLPKNVRLLAGRGAQDF